MPKPGHVSPSQFTRMMTKSRGGKGFGETAKTYAREIALERIGVELPEFGSVHTDWGNDHEWEAIQAYEAQRLVEVHSQQVWQQHPDFEWVGGTPDGLIGSEGGMDAKCPSNITNHMKNLLDNAQLDDYMLQFQGYMWITGRKWWDFVSFDPRYPKGLQLHIHRVERDEEIIEELAQRYVDFECIVQGFVDTLQDKLIKSEVLI